MTKARRRGPAHGSQTEAYASSMSPRFSRRPRPVPLPRRRPWRPRPPATTRSVQSGVRGEHGADFPEGLEGGPVRDRDHPATREKDREFLFGDALLLDALEQRRGHQHDSNAGVLEPLVDLADQQLAEGDVLLAEPHRRAAGLQAVVQLGGSALPVVPGMTEEEVATLRVLARLLHGLPGEGLNRPPLGRRVGHGPTSSGPTRPPSAGRPAAA